jgi:hypothetical protein
LKLNTIHGTVWNLDARLPSAVYKPARGLFRLIRFREKGSDELQPRLIPVSKVQESDFYPRFSDWLIGELEWTRAIVVGGNRFGTKWGTPDVIAVRKPPPSAILQRPIEVASAEIKIDPSQLVTAFGQACAYCLFSHRSFLAVPTSSPSEEIDRLDSLCEVFGIGLVLFDAASPSSPGFDSRVRPRRQEPDFFYVNKYLKEFEQQLFL